MIDATTAKLSSVERVSCIKSISRLCECNGAEVGDESRVCSWTFISNWLASDKILTTKFWNSELFQARGKREACTTRQ